MSQVKEQDKTPEKELNEMETSNLPGTELTDYRGRIDEFRDNFNKEIANIKMETENKKEPVRNEDYIR